jgi:hypothetical protein
VAQDDRQKEPASSNDALRRELELRKKLTEQMAQDSRKSAILGFVAGAVIVAGLAVTFVSTVQTRRSLQTEIGKSDSLRAQVTAKSAEAEKATQDTATVKTVLSTTMEDLQAKGPDVALNATAALDHAFDADPTAAKLLVRVYIHTRIKAQHQRAVEIAKFLRKAGYVVPGIDVQPYPPGAYSSTEVHYYANEPQSVSDASDIQSVVAKDGIPVVAKQVTSSEKLRPRAYGLWLAADLQ